jgi:hypothetical protein
MANKTGHIKKIILNKKGNEPAIDKLADFCDFHSLYANDQQLSISFESFFVDDHSSMCESLQQQIPADLGALKELLPRLYELYTQLVVEANENGADQASQTDSSNRLYASLKRHPE